MPARIARELIPRMKKIELELLSYFLDNVGDGNAKSGRRYVETENRNDSREFVVLQTQLAFFPDSRSKQVIPNSQ